MSENDTIKTELKISKFFLMFMLYFNSFKQEFNHSIAILIIERFNKNNYFKCLNY